MQQVSKLADRILLQHRRIDVLEIDLRHLRQARSATRCGCTPETPPGRPVSARDGTRAPARDRPSCTARHRARRRDRTTRSPNGSASPSATASCAGSFSSAKFCAASAIDEGARSTPVTFAPWRANRTRSVPAPHPTSSTRRPAELVERHEPRQMVQLLEMILLEIGEEPRRARRMRRDLEVVNVRVPVRANGALGRRVIRTCGHEGLL